MEDLEKQENVPELLLSSNEQKWQTWDTKNLQAIAKQREVPYLQFDGLSYSQQFYENEKIDMSYIYPKKNKAETPFTSGIGADKIKTLGSMINGYHFEPTFTIKKNNEPIDDLSIIVTNWVRDSREKEKYDEKMRIQNRSLFAQGTAYTIERYFSYSVEDKKILSPYVDLAKLDKVKWVSKGKKGVDYCSTEHLRGTKVFLENMTLSDIRLQPRVYVVQRVQYSLLKEVFGSLERFKHVKRWKGAAMLATMYGTINAYHPDYIQQDLPMNELVEVYDRINNRYQIYIDTVPMLEDEFPLKIVSPGCGIPIAKGDLNPSEDFAISRSIPFDIKIDQQLYDLTFKIALIKMKQSAYVPSVNNTGKYMTASVYEPAMMSEGFQAEKIQKLIEDPGIKQADFSLLQLIKEIINDKSINPVLEGQAGGSNTLGEYMDKTRKAMLKIGYVFDAVTNWEKQKALLRFYNLCAYGIRKKDGNYESLSLSDADDADTTWNVKFQDENYSEEEDVFEEDIAAEKEGRSIKNAIISPKLLREILDDPAYSISVDIVPVDKNNDMITQMKLVQKITQAMQLFGPESLAVERLKKRYARVMGEKFEDFFKTPEEVELEMAQAQQEMAQYVQNQAQQKGGAGATEEKKVVPRPQGADYQKQMVDGFFQ